MTESAAPSTAAIRPQRPSRTYRPTASAMTAIVCTGTETCDAVLDCQATNSARTRHDGVSCTIDSCDPGQRYRQRPDRQPLAMTTMSAPAPRPAIRGARLSGWHTAGSTMTRRQLHVFDSCDPSNRYRQRPDRQPQCDDGGRLHGHRDLRLRCSTVRLDTPLNRAMMASAAPIDSCDPVAGIAAPERPDRQPLRRLGRLHGHRDLRRGARLPGRHAAGSG